MTRLSRVLSSTATVSVACGISLVLGLFFVWVWSPHPWGWYGIDHYHDRALALARGEPFGTTDVPWGYAYYVAAVYALFGAHAWIPVTLQAVLNATIPWMVYRLVRPSTDQRTAVTSALLVGIFSFNTVYASTQASDSICTVLFVASLLAFDTGRRTERMRWFVLAGLLSGLVPQFRPNMLLFPLVLVAAYVLLLPRSLARARVAVVYLLMCAVALVPWVVRNYRLTGLFLPTSTHGAVQLWYGTLQTGPYLESRAYNPRSFFETAAFEYTSLAETPIVVSAQPRGCAFWTDVETRLTYWTDADDSRRSVPGIRDESGFSFHLPGQPDHTTVYYYLQAVGSDDGREVAAITPPYGDEVPAVVFVSSNHLGDLDRHDDFADVFDVIRLLQQSDAEGASPALQPLVATLLAPAVRETATVSEVSVTDSRVAMALNDGSTFSVPRGDVDRVTDAEVSGGWAAALLYSRVRKISGRPYDLGAVDACRLFDAVRVNEVFYRKEPHQMRRYTALALDNISRDPIAFLAASLYRTIRLFIVRGTADRSTTQQFVSSSIVYGAATVVSGAIFVMLLAGIVIARRRHYPLLVLLLPIVYVPLTIGFVLTNMRYVITVQPFVFVFVAIALLAALRVRAGETTDSSQTNPS